MLTAGVDLAATPKRTAMCRGFRSIGWVRSSARSPARSCRRWMPRYAFTWGS